MSKPSHLYTYRTDSHIGNIDEQPEIKAALRDWMEGLDLEGGWSVAHRIEVETIEYKGRDGFIPHRHNRGGFDKVYMTDVDACNGSGCGPSLAEIDRVATWAYEQAAKDFALNRADELKGVPADKVNYHDLHELGLSRLAEDLSEMESEYMRCPVWWGVRAMYEGRNSQGVHTLCIYASGNVDEYHGPFGKGSEDKGEWEIRFKTVSGLQRQLKRIKSKVEGSF